VFGEAALKLFLAFVMDAVKERTFSAVFKLNRIYAENAVLIYAKCPHDLGAYVSFFGPSRTSPFLAASALRKFPAFHIGPPFREGFTEAVPCTGVTKSSSRSHK
jgi:hypothetical protein